MCGITGFLNARAETKRDELLSNLESMTNRMIHRGPDDAGHFVREQSGLALGFRRLAIVDLSPAGHQPMSSRSGRYDIVFNGEIYNHRELSEELQASAGRQIFRGHSDTEVILEAIEQWGLMKAVKRFHGMFAIALWDDDLQTLSLIRDRMGEKPLYYGTCGGTFLFGSELKVLRAHPAFVGTVDQASLAPYLTYGYVPAPRSIYQNIKKLIPGTMLQVKWRGGHLEENSMPYWSLAKVRDAGVASQTTGSDVECRDELDRILREVIGQQMVADVPLGAFLSGGIDSSTVVAIMQSLSDRPVKTFTIGFDEDAHSEARFARGVADHLGVDHTELTVTGADALAMIPTLPTVFDEPFSDPSQIPTMLVSKLARTQVTVSLSGDGADELFGGYDRYHRATGLWNQFGKVPQQLRVGVGKTFSKLPSGNMVALAKAARLGQFLERSSDPDVFYDLFVASDFEAWRSLSTDVQATIHSMPPRSGSDSADVLRRFMHLDALAYLPDDILVKVDRASMAYSLESRAPFLDDRVVEFAATLPTSMLVREERGKWILREVLYKYLPKSLVDRPKMGFGVPLAEWLQGPLREWAETLLNEKSLRSQGFLDPVYVRGILNEQLSGKIKREYQLWNILMLQAWIEDSGSSRCATEDSIVDRAA